MLRLKKIASLLLIIAGIFTIFFSETIVFSWIERIVGIEALVGKENVVYFEGGGYVYTNPRAMIVWTGLVSLIGFLQMMAGIVSFIVLWRKGNPSKTMQLKEF